MLITNLTPEPLSITALQTLIAPFLFSVAVDKEKSFPGRLCWFMLIFSVDCCKGQPVEWDFGDEKQEQK